MNANGRGGSIMRKWIYCVTFLTLIVLITGCGAYYMMNGEKFSSSSEALQKQSEILSNSLDKVAPTENSVHGTALVLIPSDVEIQKNYIILGNNAYRFEKEQIDYMITSTANDCQFMANAIRKRAIFDSVSVARHNGNPTSFPIGDNEFVVFLDVDGWFVKGKDSPRALQLPFDPKISDIDSRRFAFLDSLSKQASIIRGK
jgi:hypothetical protein